MSRTRAVVALLDALTITLTLVALVLAVGASAPTHRDPRPVPTREAYTHAV